MLSKRLLGVHAALFVSEFLQTIVLPGDPKVFIFGTEAALLDFLMMLVLM